MHMLVSLLVQVSETFHNNKYRKLNPFLDPHCWPCGGTRVRLEARKSLRWPRQRQRGWSWALGGGRLWDAEHVKKNIRRLTGSADVEAERESNQWLQGLELDAQEHRAWRCHPTETYWESAIALCMYMCECYISVCMRTHTYYAHIIWCLNVEYITYYNNSLLNNIFTADIKPLEILYSWLLLRLVLTTDGIS